MRRRGWLGDSSAFNLEVSNFDLLLTVLALLSSFLVITNFQQDLERALIAIAFSVFCIAGLTLGLASFGVQRDKNVSTGELLERVNWGIVGFIAIAMLQLAVNSLDFFSAIEFYDVLFLFIAAVAETWLFQYFLLVLLYRLSPPGPVGLRMMIVATLDAAIFASYHAVVYAARPDAILVVFLGGIVLAMVNLVTRSVLPAMLAHIMNNVPILALLLALLPP